MNSEQYMHTALSLARLGLGRTWPNPSVGCVIVKNDEIIAQTRTANSGRPHAEVLALQSTTNNQQSTIYVTLEPCAHHGKTPPCAEALVNAGVAEVVIGCLDPDPRTSGKGIKILRDAGIKVSTGVLEKECREANKGFFKVMEKNLPYTMLKVATSSDGKYLPGDGKPKWVTGKASREEVQTLRAQYDAILTSTGTVLADNPRLDCRLSGWEDYSPVKIVTGNRPVSGSANILRGKETWFYGDGIAAIKDLAKRGITRLMIEAGPKLSTALLKAKLVDEIIIFQSPHELKNEGKKFFAEDYLANFKKISEKKSGDDLMQTWIKS